MESLNPNGSAFYVLEVILLFTVPLFAFFLGVFIRKFALPSRKSPPLSKLLLLSIPVSFVVVAPFIIVIPPSIAELPKMLLTLGIIMEHGMVVPETLSAHLQKLFNEPVDDSPVRRSA